MKGDGLRTDPKKWVAFKRLYLTELKANKTFDQLLMIASATDPVTLVYSSKDPKHNSALILRKYLESALKKKRQKEAAAAKVHKWDT